MFLLNSCLGQFSAASSRWHSFSRSYGVILPSSLTILLPPALGFSPHPPVSVYGTGTYKTIAAFLDSQGPGLPYLCSVRVTSSDRAADLPTALLPRLRRAFHSRLVLSTRVPTVLLYRGTGISTCCPSVTSFDLALGPDLPRADQLYSGNLRYSAGRILTFLSLLIPAFSLLYSPQLLIGTASSRIQCSSTNDLGSFLSFGSVFQPRTFSAQDLSTSELLRTL